MMMATAVWNLAGIAFGKVFPHNIPNPLGFCIECVYLALTSRE